VIGKPSSTPPDPDARLIGFQEGYGRIRSGYDHWVMMPLQGSIRQNRDPKHRYQWLASGIADVLIAVSGMRCLQNLFHFDL
jgi:hypothetical protein